MIGTLIKLFTEDYYERQKVVNKQHMKTYFANIGYLCDEFTFAKKTILEEMKENDISETIVYEAVRETGSEFFYCRANCEVGTKGEGTCGKFCDDYSPRNGRSGICRHNAPCYEKGQAYRLFADGRMEMLEDG